MEQKRQPKAWGYEAGLAFGMNMLLAGLLLQLAFGGIDWSSLAFPVNTIILLLLVAALAAMNALRSHVRFFSWLGSGVSSACSIAFATLVTVAMGLIRQASPEMELEGAVGISGLRQMASAWYFVLPYSWMTVSLGLTVLRRLSAGLTLRNICFISNHLGLFMVLTCLVLGGADLQRLELAAMEKEPQDQAKDRRHPGRLVKLPFAIELEKFVLEEYPPKLVVMDNASGKMSEAFLSVGEQERELCGWTISIREAYSEASPSGGGEALSFRPYMFPGGCHAVHVVADSAGVRRDGWVGDGSFLFPRTVMPLGDATSLVMPPCAPKRFSSEVNIFQTGKNGEMPSLRGTIEVNKPMKMESWKIYQKGYDQDMGRWSKVSVLELVRDPWQPAVSLGILLMLFGAAMLILTSSGKPSKEEER